MKRIEQQLSIIVDIKYTASDSFYTLQSLRNNKSHGVRTSLRMRKITEKATGETL